MSLTHTGVRCMRRGDLRASSSSMRELLALVHAMGSARRRAKNQLGWPLFVDERNVDGRDDRVRFVR